MTKSYTFGAVTCGYSPSARKWAFNIGTGSNTFTLLTAIKGGADTAQKIANVVSAGYKRTKNTGIDGMARANISTIINRVS